jgi:Tfp pilus assembly protein PilF
LQHALSNFNEAVARDPTFAPAYSGMAITYNLLREYSGMADEEAYPKAKAAAEHGIELDPNLPQAHASLGFIDFFWFWDPAKAEQEFRAALDVDPGSVLAHHWYGSMLLHQGRFEESIQQLDIAQRLEPTSAAIVSTRALALGLSGHREEAQAQLMEILKEAPSANSPHNTLRTLSLVEPRNIPMYLAETKRLFELRQNPTGVQRTDAAERAYRDGGETAMWSKILEWEKQAHPGTGNANYQTIEAEAALGQNDAALEGMEQLARQHDANLVGINNDPVFQPLHNSPRYTRIIALAGIRPSNPTK